MKQVMVNFTQHLKEHKLRLTSERLQLVELILSLKGHFSPEEVLTRVKDKKLSVSRATIYRLLPVLVEAHLIQQSLLSEGETRFEVTWNKDHHDHLICSNCNRVIEFHDNTIEILQREIANKYGFTLDDHVMELRGRCRNCRDA